MAIFGSLLFCSISQGQLRSGRTERRLYQGNFQPERISIDTPHEDGARQTAATQRRGEHQHRKSNRQRTATVVTASHEESYSVLEQAVGTPELPIQPLPPEPIHQHVASAEHVVWDSPSEWDACDSCGCGGSGCNVCRSHAQWLAPGASAACAPHCGPLMTILKKLQIRAEVPLYWRRDQGGPPLVTTSPTGTAAEDAGRLGESTTDILFGGGTLRDQSNAGLRLTFNTWLGPDQCNGIMFRYWNAGSLSDVNEFNSNDFPILARPFFNTSVEGSFEQDAQLVAFPESSIGSVRVDNDSRVDGLELTFRRQLYKDRFNRLDWMTGYQHVRIEEGLTIFSHTDVIGNTPGLDGASIAVVDNFQTENDFHGFFYGLTNTRVVACWKIETMFRLGMGNLRRKVSIAGMTTTSSGGVSETENQGLLARNTNSQPYLDDTFVVIPEVGINLAYRIFRGLDFNVGYNYMLIPKVGQPAQQIDFTDGNPAVAGDPTRIPVNLSDPLVGALDPSLNFDERNYWLHSLGLGLQWNY